MCEKTCKDCISFGYTDDKEDTVCFAGAGLVLEDAEPCIFFEDKVTNSSLD